MVPKGVLSLLTIGPSPDDGASRKSQLRPQMPEKSGIDAGLPAAIAGNTTLALHNTQAVRRASSIETLTSKIRLLGLRNVLEALMQHVGIILGADRLVPVAPDAAVGHLRRPGHGEDVRILDRELHLESLAVLQIDRRDTRLGADTACDLFLTRERFLRLSSIDEPIALDDVHRLALRRAESVGRGVGLKLDTDRVDDELVAFIMADGMSHRRRRQFRRMPLAQPNVPNLIVVGVEDDDLVLQLEHLHAELDRE